MEREREREGGPRIESLMLVVSAAPMRLDLVATTESQSINPRLEWPGLVIPQPWGVKKNKGRREYLVDYHNAVCIRCVVTVQKRLKIHPDATYYKGFLA